VVVVAHDDRQQWRTEQQQHRQRTGDEYCLERSKLLAAHVHGRRNECQHVMLT
jgi:hypothetical protein